jgi:site-specific recombinase XerD
MTNEEILQKLLKDLEARGRNKKTISGYMSKVNHFQVHFGKPADQMGENEILEYQRYLVVEKGLLPASVNDHISSIRFLYGVTLDVALNYKKVPRLKQTRRIPQIFNREEVVRIIGNAGNLAHKTMLMLAYGSGLRCSEITNLKVLDIDSKHMRILIRHGKGDIDRYAMLPRTTLALLRKYWIEYRPDDWLFVAPCKGGKYVNRTLADAFKSALQRSGVKKSGSIHTFRHCFATHFYEDTHDLLALKKLLGHARISTTAWYTKLADSQVFRLKSPIDALFEGHEENGYSKKEKSDA